MGGHGKPVDQRNLGAFGSLIRLRSVQPDELPEQIDPVEDPHGYFFDCLTPAEVRRYELELEDLDRRGYKGTGWKSPEWVALFKAGNGKFDELQAIAVGGLGL